MARPHHVTYYMYSNNDRTTMSSPYVYWVTVLDRSTLYVQHSSSRLTTGILENPINNITRNISIHTYLKTIIFHDISEINRTHSI